MKKRLFFSILFLTVQFAFSQWAQLGQDINGEAADDWSGRSVSLSSNGTIVAIGAYLNDDNGMDSGHVRVYQFDGVSWNQLGQDIDGEFADDWSGRAVSLNSDGTIVAIGALRNDGNFNNSGHVRIYEFDGINWNQIGQDINGEVANDGSGRSVSLNSTGNRIAIGASGNDGNGNGSGHVRVYQFNGVSWNQLGQDIDGEAAGDLSGRAVSLNSDGTIVAIGALNNSDNGFLSGHVRIYEFDGVSWNQIGTDIDGEAAEDESGSSVSLNSDGNRVAIGAPRNDDNGLSSGHVRIYSFDGVSWSQIGQDIDGEASLDNSGHSVSLNSDGNRVAIGALFNDDSAFSSGHVRIYEFDGISWNQIGADIDGEAADDQSGISVSLSSDGNSVAIGAPRNDDNGNNSGHVRVYASLLYTAIPDSNFEAALDALGYDDIPGDNQAPTFTISGITYLDISYQNIADLSGIEDFIALETLLCNNNNLTSVDLSNNNNLMSLNINNNRYLTYLDCSNDDLTSLDVTNTSLQELRCNGNQLSSLNVIDLGNLEILYCHNNQLTSLDVSENSDLQVLHCYNNQLTGSLNLSEVWELQDFNATNNPGLACIQVESPEEVEAGEDRYAGWIKDPATMYSEDCGGMMAKSGISDTKDTKDPMETEPSLSTNEVMLYPNPVKELLSIALPAGLELQAVTLYNLRGERVALSKTKKLNVAHLAKGVYFARIRLADGRRSVKKVIISGE